jgi:hypothetical protein
MLARSRPVAGGVRPRGAVGEHRFALVIGLPIEHNLVRPPGKQPTVREPDAHAQGNIVGIDGELDRGQKGG